MSYRERSVEESSNIQIGLLRGMSQLKRSPATVGCEIRGNRSAPSHAEDRVAIYFCDPHNPWPRGSNESINVLSRQSLPQGADSSRYSLEQLDAIAYD